MPINTSRSRGGKPGRRAQGRARDGLRSCGCYSAWEEYTRLVIECKFAELNVKRLGFCISEQCWSPGDIDGLTLTGSDRAVPYPDVVHQCLSNKLKNAKACKKEKFENAKEKRILLTARHNLCHVQYRTDLNVLFKVTTHEVNTVGATREA